MKLSEWERFSRIIDEKAPMDRELQKAFDECLTSLSSQGKRQLLFKLERLQELSEIIQSTKKEEVFS